MGVVIIPANRLEDFVVAVFKAVGVPEPDAKICAEVLVTADLRAIESHGVNRLKMYYDRIKAGIQSPRTDYKIIKNQDAVAVIDGNLGMGQVIAYHSMKLAIAKARTYGIGAVAVRNSTHFGIAGYYAEQAIKSDMIGLVLSNARPSVAPTFGAEPLFGTNPIAIGAPSDDTYPFLFDAATSITQRGKLEVYARKHEQLPEGLVIDSEGNFCTEPAKLLRGLLDGACALLPLGGKTELYGGHKGYGLAIAIEIFCACLQAGSYLKQLGTLPYRLGHFFLAIDIAHFIDVTTFKRITGDILRTLRTAKKLPDALRIWTAGEREYETENYRRKHGIPISTELQTELESIAQELNIELLKEFKRESGGRKAST